MLSYGKGGAWFESGPDPVLAESSSAPANGLRSCHGVPAEWAGKRTIRYVDPADDNLPKLQKPTVYFEHPISLR